MTPITKMITDLPLVAPSANQRVKRDEDKQDTKQIGCHGWARSSTRERAPSMDESGDHAKIGAARRWRALRVADRDRA